MKQNIYYPTEVFSSKGEGEEAQGAAEKEAAEATEKKPDADGEAQEEQKTGAVKGREYAWAVQRAGGWSAVLARV